MLKNNVTTFIHTQHLGESIELNDSPAEAADGFVKQKRDIRFVDGAEVIIPWHEVAAVITGNQMTQAPDVEGFCVESGGVNPARVTIFNGQITTEPTQYDMNRGIVTASWPKCDRPEEIYVTFEGRQYTLPSFYLEEMDMSGYGEAIASGPVFDHYPVLIVPYIDAMEAEIYTETAGTYGLTIECEDICGGGPGPK